jgi:hypothetical protein
MAHRAKYPLSRLVKVRAAARHDWQTQRLYGVNSRNVAAVMSARIQVLAKGRTVSDQFKELTYHHLPAMNDMSTGPTI